MLRCGTKAAFSVGLDTAASGQELPKQEVEDGSPVETSGWWVASSVVLIQAGLASKLSTN